MFRVSDLLQWTSGTVANHEELGGHSIESLEITGLKSLKEAGSGDLAFFFSKHYEADLRQTQASVIVTGNGFLPGLKAAGLDCWKRAVFVACAEPYLAMGKVTAQVSKRVSAHDHQDSSGAARIHPSAFIDPSAKIGIGVVIYPHVYVGPRCVVGDQSVLFPSVTLYEGTVVGKRVRIHAGSVIGADGFGYAPIMDPATRKPVGHQKIYHLGGVLIEDDVEIGANSTIDRGTLGNTIIRKNVKIDNLVQVGHNCEVGEGTVLCGAAGMAGSSSMGKFVTVAAQAGTGNQVHVGDYSVLRPYAGVDKDLPPGSDVIGVPARPLREAFKISALQSRMLKAKDSKKENS